MMTHPGSSSSSAVQQQYKVMLSQYSSTMRT
jgi:hypothetical protein